MSAFRPAHRAPPAAIALGVGVVCAQRFRQARNWDSNVNQRVRCYEAKTATMKKARDGISSERGSLPVLWSPS